MSNLNEQLEQLPKAMQPSRDLWPSIAAKLDKPAQTSSNQNPWQWVAIAASMALVSVLSFNMGKSQIVEQDNSQMLAMLELINNQHQTQVQQYQAKVQLTSWGQLSQEPVDAGLTEVRTASDEVFKTLLAQPDNQKLQKLWLWLLEKEREILRESQQPQLNSI
ncbi:hypothetical protein [Paraferrimonas sp. SM1919]|uniref:hypothetical protein n=1 Tax=Paraferrimonas sp. SM1919 TaxID=2662263 RepID=UPI0013D15857|nr:hypothetical protein [Paraferrimonas sp. SM1919]